MELTNTLFQLVVVILSVIVHEVSHGYAALWFGDNTAKHAGRLTLNPLPHIDPIGSVIIPGFLALSGSGMLFGWAKPVPVNLDNLLNKRVGSFVVAIAGIASNLLIALVFGLVLRMLLSSGLSSPELFYACSVIVVTNISLGIFNLLPVPPLDGSKVFAALLPLSVRMYLLRFEQYSFYIGLAFLLFISRFDFISPVIRFLYGVLVGVAI